MMEIKRFKIKDSMNRGKINIVRYYIEDYKNKDNNGFKVLRDIEQTFLLASQNIIEAQV